MISIDFPSPVVVHPRSQVIPGRIIDLSLPGLRQDSGLVFLVNNYDLAKFHRRNGLMERWNSTGFSMGISWIISYTGFIHMCAYYEYKLCNYCIYIYTHDIYMCMYQHTVLNWYIMMLCHVWKIYVHLRSCIYRQVLWLATYHCGCRSWQCSMNDTSPGQPHRSLRRGTSSMWVWQCHKPPMTGNGEHANHLWWWLGDGLLLLYPH